MRRLVAILSTLAACLLLVPAVADGQELPPDRDCTDFDTRTEAQGWYEAMRILSDSSTDDPHRLDANGDGQACESIETMRIEQTSDTTSYATEEYISTVTCPDTTFALSDYRQILSEGISEQSAPDGYAQMERCVAMQMGLARASEPPPPPGDASFTYEQDCLTNVHNATVHAPASAAPTLPDGTPVEPGDTLAVYTESGVCAGYGVWGEQGATLAAAGTDSVGISTDGYPAGEALKIEVFDLSAGQATRPAATWASCAEMDVPVCAEGAYQDGSFHQLVGFSSN